MDMTIEDILGGTEEREQADTARRAKTNQQADDLRFVMSHVSGRRFVWELLDFAGMWRPSFTADRLSTDFNEGSRNVALMLWGKLQHECPEQLLRMQEENKPCV